MMVIFIEVVVFFDLRAEMGRSGGKLTQPSTYGWSTYTRGPTSYEINLKLMEPDIYVESESL